MLFFPGSPSRSRGCPFVDEYYRTLEATNMEVELALRLVEENDFPGARTFTSMIVGERVR